MFECDSYAEESEKWDHVIPVKIVWKNLTDREVYVAQKKLSTEAEQYNFTLTTHLEITLNFTLCNNDELLPIVVETPEATSQFSQSFILTCFNLSKGFESKRHQHTCDPLIANRLRNAVDKKQAKNGYEDCIVMLVCVVILISLQIGILFIANKCKKRRQTD